MLREVTLFQSLFSSNKWIWLFGWMFHVALLSVLLRHLRYFTEPVWGWVALIQPFGLLRRLRDGRGARRPVGAALPGRPRALHQRPVRPPDAALLVAIAASGLAMKYRRAHRHRRAEGVLPRPDGLRLAAAARRPGAARAPRAGGDADDRLSRFASCCTRRASSSARRATRSTTRASSATSPAGRAGRRRRA